MKLLKKYKWIVVGFFILFLIIILYIASNLFLSHEGAIYGNRLDGIKTVPITSSDKQKVSDLITSETGITKVETNVHGKLYNIVIFVDETMTVAKIKEIADKTLDKLSEEQKAFYDISFLINYASKSTKTDFPIIGYKNKSSEKIVW